MISSQPIWIKQSLIVVTACAALTIGYVAAKAVRRHSSDTAYESNGHRHTAHLAKLPDLSFIDLKTGRTQRFTSTDAGPYDLLVFLSAADCSGCLALLPKWNGVLASENHLLVGHLVFVNCTASEAREASSFYNSRFSVWFDSTGEAADRLNIQQTPFTVLVDSHLHPVLSQGSNNEAEAQDAFARSVEQLTASSGH